jgi:Fur family zinc uptake transcriptional regulator
MMAAPILPQPCNDPECRGPHRPAERVALAESLCSARGVRLTALRRRVLELLWEFGRPTKAYELIAALKCGGSRRVSPPTVYRVLDFLIEERLVSRIESRNAFVPCMHPERRYDCIHLICKTCGSSVDLESSTVQQLLTESGSAFGFSISKRIVEVEGTCAGCIKPGKVAPRDE